MSQISPPLRILLAGSIIFLAAWFVILKPGGGDEAASTVSTITSPTGSAAPSTAQAAPGSPVGKAVQQANGAAAASNAANAAVTGADPATAAAPSAPATSSAATPATGGATAQAPASPAAPAGAPSKGDVKAAGLPRSVAKAVASNKVLVMLFWNPKAADDRVVRRELRHIPRHKGKVAVHVANVREISRYAPITRGVNVDQSPSVVVVGRDRQADLLSGYADRVTIAQAVSDAIRGAR